MTNAGAEAVCKGKGSYRVMVALDPESPKGTTISAPVAPKGYRAQVRAPNTFSFFLKKHTCEIPASPHSCAIDPSFMAQVIRNSQAIVYTFEGASVPAESESDFSGTITMPTTGTARVRKHYPLNP